jgi:hypothetical protein
VVPKPEHGDPLKGSPPIMYMKGGRVGGGQASTGQSWLPRWLAATPRKNQAREPRTLPAASKDKPKALYTPHKGNRNTNSPPPMMLAGVIPPTSRSGEGKTPPSMMLAVVPPTGCCGEGKTLPSMMLVVIPPTGCGGEGKTPPPMMLAVVPPTGHCDEGEMMVLMPQRIRAREPSTRMKKK